MLLESILFINSHYSFVSDELFAPPRPSEDVRISSLCIFSEPKDTNKPPLGRSCLVVGVGLQRYSLTTTPNVSSSAKNSSGFVEMRNTVNQSTLKSTETLNILDIDKKSDLNPGTNCQGDNQKGAEIEKEKGGGASEYGYSVKTQVHQSNFVPYLLIYDLSPLAHAIFQQPQQQVGGPKAGQKLGHQGTSKKSTRKAAAMPSMNYPLLFDDNPSTPTTSSLTNSKDFNNKKKSSNSTPTTDQNDNSHSDNNKKVPKCLQCISLPAKISSTKKFNYCINHLVLTLCGRYLLLSVSLENIDKHFEINSIAPDLSNNDNLQCTSAFLLYKVNSSDSYLGLAEEPKVTQFMDDANLVPKQMVMIPTIVSSNLLHLYIIYCQTGSLEGKSPQGFSNAQNSWLI